jgi:hypothetical protein
LISTASVVTRERVGGGSAAVDFDPSKFGGTVDINLKRASYIVQAVVRDRFPESRSEMH